MKSILIDKFTKKLICNYNKSVDAHNTMISMNYVKNLIYIDVNIV